MRFFLLDKITALDIGSTIEGIKCWTLSEEFYFEHFPGYPVVPGVLQIESMAQLLGLLVEKSCEQEFGRNDGYYVIMSMVNKAKFRELVHPGDQCFLKGTLKSIDINRGQGQVETFVKDKLVSEAHLSFIIGSRSDYPENHFLSRRNEYLQALGRESGINLI